MSKSFKNHLFSHNLKVLKIFFLLQKKCSSFCLPIENISLRPVLSSPSRFRFQGGGGILSVTKDGRTDERKSSCLALAVWDIQCLEDSER